MSSSLQPCGLWLTRLLYPWDSPRQEYWSWLPCPPPRDLPNSGMDWNLHLLCLLHWQGVVYHQCHLGSLLYRDFQNKFLEFFRIKLLVCKLLGHLHRTSGDLRRRQVQSTNEAAFPYITVLTNQLNSCKSIKMSTRKVLREIWHKLFF